MYGENSVDVKQPTFWHHLADRLTSPFVVFNLFNQVDVYSSTAWAVEVFLLHTYKYISRFDENSKFL